MSHVPDASWLRNVLIIIIIMLHGLMLASLGLPSVMSVTALPFEMDRDSCAVCTTDQHGSLS